MGMDNYIERINNKKLNTFEEFEEYDNIYGDDFSDEILYFRRHYWLDNFFRHNCKNSRAYDEVILTKEDIEKLIKNIEYNINNNGKDLDKNSFYSDNILQELNNTLEKIKKLLNEDFENNTIYYNSYS